MLCGAITLWHQRISHGDHFVARSSHGKEFLWLHSQTYFVTEKFASMPFARAIAQSDYAVSKT